MREGAEQGISRSALARVACVSPTIVRQSGSSRRRYQAHASHLHQRLIEESIVRKACLGARFDGELATGGRALQANEDGSGGAAEGAMRGDFDAP